MVRILTDFSEQVEAAMVEIRKSADRIEESSRRLVGAAEFRDIRLSDISLPDSFPDAPGPTGGKDATPVSKKSLHPVATAGTPVVPIDLDSPDHGRDVPIVGAEGERNRSLNEVFEQMDAGVKSPTIGSQV